MCIIKTISLTEIAFKDVPESFAYREGEGDKSLEYWKRVHKEVFEMETQSYGETFNETMTVLCEEFDVVFK